MGWLLWEPVQALVSPASALPEQVLEWQASALRLVRERVASQVWQVPQPGQAW